MKLPPFISEEQFMEAFENVISKLSPKFAFTIFDKDDIHQEAFIIASEGVFNYNPDLNVPLESFLYTHLHNRLFNFRRNNYLRREINCKTCHKNKTQCNKCKRRENLNATKKAILEPYNIENVNHPISNINLDDKLDNKMLLEAIIDRLPVDLISDFYKIIDGVRINTNKKKYIISLIKEIAKEIGYAT